MYLNKDDLSVLYVAVRHALQETQRAESSKVPPEIIAVAGEPITLSLVYGSPSEKGHNGILYRFMVDGGFQPVEHLEMVARSFNRLTEAKLLARLERGAREIIKKRATFQYVPTHLGISLYKHLEKIGVRNWPLKTHWTGDPAGIGK